MMVRDHRHGGTPTSLRDVLLTCFLVASTPYAIAEGSRHVEVVYVSTALLVVDCRGGTLFEDSTGIHSDEVRGFGACDPVLPGETRVRIEVRDASQRPVSYLVRFFAGDSQIAGPSGEFVICTGSTVVASIPPGATEIEVAKAFSSPPRSCEGKILGAATAGSVLLDFS